MRPCRLKNLPLYFSTHFHFPSLLLAYLRHKEITSMPGVEGKIESVEKSLSDLRLVAMAMSSFVRSISHIVRGKERIGQKRHVKPLPGA